MLIVTRAGVFRGLTMRSVDDRSEYPVPVRKRTWTNRYGFRKRNNTRAVPLNAPKRITPEKHSIEVSAGVQRRLYAARDPNHGIITNFVIVGRIVD